MVDAQNSLKGYYRQEENIILFRNPPRVDYGVLHDSISVNGLEVVCPGEVKGKAKKVTFLNQ